MLKKFLLFVAAFVLTAGAAWAQVDVNKADQAALDGVRGIGPSMSKRILAERQKGGSFKDWSDLQHRVKGIKEKSATKLSANGLTVNGQPWPQAGQPGERTVTATKAGRAGTSDGDKAKAVSAKPTAGDKPASPAPAGDKSDITRK